MTDLLDEAIDFDIVAETVEKARREIRYLVTDFTFEIIVSKFRDEAEDEGDIFVPDYQRTLAWNPAQQSYLIESLILRYPIPPIFFYDIRGRLEIVDGTQRIRSMERFSRDAFKLSGIEKLDILNGFYYSNLPISVQKRLNNTPIRAFVLDDTTDESTRADLFRRLNTSGKKLSDSEIRKGVFKGPFLDLILDCAQSEQFIEAAPKVKSRQESSEREELATRFLVYVDHYQQFRHDVRKFLDRHVIEQNREITRDEAQRKLQEFNSVMQFVSQYLGTGFYRPNRLKQVPRVRFEAISVGCALALRQNPQIIPEDTAWLDSEEFDRLVRTDASNSGPKLRGRIEFVRDKLLGA